MKTFHYFALLILAIHAGNASAYQIDQSMFNLLPPHCKAKYAAMSKLGKVEGITIQPEQYKPLQWKKRIGKPFNHFHHYCPGLKMLNQAKFKTKNAREKNFLLAKAKKQITYVIQHSEINKQNAWLFAEIHAYLAEIAELRKDRGEAIKQYSKAIKLYPRYSKAYIGLSNLYISLGQNEDALEIVQKGIKARPKSKWLRKQERKIKEILGKSDATS